MEISLQKLKPPAARLCLKVEKFIKDELGLDLKDKKILISLSGGIDSTALLIILYALNKRLAYKSLSAAHLNHLIRPEAKKDEIFCKELCRSLNIDFYSSSVDVPKMQKTGAMGLEEAARTARYNYLDSLKNEHQFDWLALGHQLEDLAEDQFMRLLRGAGWPELAGMTGVNLQKKTFRPLLLIKKDELEKFLSSIPLSHVEDKTNFEAFCLRNRVRLEISPFFIKENPNYLERVANLWQMAQIDKKGLEKLLPSAELKNNKSIILKKEALNIPKALRLRLYKKALDKLGPGQALYKNILRLDDLWLKKRSGSKIQFPGRKKAEILPGEISFCLESKPSL